MTRTSEEAIAELERLYAQMRETAPARLRKGVVDDLCDSNPSVPRSEWEALYDAEFPGEVA